MQQQPAGINSLQIPAASDSALHNALAVMIHSHVANTDKLEQQVVKYKKLLAVVEDNNGRLKQQVIQEQQRVQEQSNKALVNYQACEFHQQEVQRLKDEVTALQRQISLAHSPESPPYTGAGVEMI
jgi:hypothetical protein